MDDVIALADDGMDEVVVHKRNYVRKRSALVTELATWKHL